MVESHTISASEEIWEQVFDYADKNNLKPSQVTVLAWNNLFQETKTFRLIDIIIIFMLFGLFILILLGVWAI